MRRALPKLLVLVAMAFGAGWLWEHRADVARDLESLAQPDEDIAVEGPVGEERIPLFDRDGRRRTGTDAPGRPPAPVPGEALEVTLTEPPARYYGKHEWAESDRYLGRIARTVGGLRYDPALAHAARELAGFHAVEHELAPGIVLPFLLDAGGAAEWGVEQKIRVTSAEGDGTLRELLEQVADSREPGQPPPRVGIGESWSLGRPPRRHVAALVAHGELGLDPVPREVPASSTVRVSGTLPDSVAELEVLAMDPDLEVREVPVDVSGTMFRADVPTGETPGPLAVELIARAGSGPEPLAQLDLHVDEAVPERIRTTWPPDESDVEDAAAAEELAFDLVDADRARFGLPPLERDPRLDAVARAHSADMAENGFFGHVSPTTGSVSDRLGAVGYKSGMHAENIARNDTIHDAQSGLMRSIGHRRNILSPEATRVGVGVVATRAHGPRQWVLTQVFAKPSPVIEPEVARRKVLDALQHARREAGLDPLRADGRLATLAGRHARDRSPSPRAVLDGAQRVLPRGGWASVATLHDITHLEVPRDVLESRYHRVGVGVFQDRSRQGADITVVLVVGG
ncbi:MAG: CAP domain-containing protein [Myxococcota bacterium]